MRFDLSDEEWAVIEPLLPKGGRGPKRVDDRRVLNGIFYILRTGAPWRDLPECYAIRLPANKVLQESIAHLLTRPVGRPPNHVRR